MTFEILLRKKWRKIGTIKQIHPDTSSMKLLDWWTSSSVCLSLYLALLRRRLKLLLLLRWWFKFVGYILYLFVLFCFNRLRSFREKEIGNSAYLKMFCEWHDLQINNCRRFKLCSTWALGHWQQKSDLLLCVLSKLDSSKAEIMYCYFSMLVIYWGKHLIVQHGCFSIMGANWGLRSPSLHLFSFWMDCCPRERAGKTKSFR